MKKKIFFLLFTRYFFVLPFVTNAVVAAAEALIGRLHPVAAASFGASAFTTVVGSLVIFRPYAVSWEGVMEVAVGIVNAVCGAFILTEKIPFKKK